MKKRILFVDDEPNILQGLKRMLRSQRNEWDMAFAESGASALEMMEKERFDAVISDMRMPGMDGAELLEKVKQKHPETVRFVLSGHSDQELVMRSVGPSHQYLSKPCDPDKLKDLLTDTFALHELLASEKLRTLVSGMTSMPSMPDIYRSIVEAVQSEDISITDIGKIIEQDIGMTTKVLQLVNSSYFGLSRQISSPAEAANFLGLDVLRGLVLANGIFSQFDEKLIQKMSLQTHGSRSLAIANAARNIAKTEGASPVIIEQAFLGGLLHDMGTLLLATNESDEYLATIALANENNLAMPEAEKQVFGTTHAEIGAYMLGLWGIDETVVSAVAYHHNPGDFPCTQFSPLTAVHAASTFISEKHMSNNINAFEGKDLEYVESIGLAERLPVWQSICEQPAEEAA
jgi:HD-like signal output (HDOD) protein/CheY-like chemotaxis protein